MLRSRYRRILWFFARTLLILGWWDILLPLLGFRSLSQRGRSQRLRKAAASFRALAVQMGGVLIKVGQFFSARLDVLPREITDELAGLQDEAQPETFADICKVVEAEFNLPLAEKFAYFDETPLASASIGQVHSAILRPSSSEQEAAVAQPVVVKVQRPNIQAIVATDLAALRVVCGWLYRYPPIRKHANIPALLDEFSRSLSEEMDYLIEGKNAETFAANFAARPEVRVPKVYWSHTTRCVLTLEDVRAIKITDYAAIEAAGVERAEVAGRLIETYLKQIFEDYFFHADPHPGNLFVMPLAGAGGSEKIEWKLVFVDFGMAGRIPPRLLAGLRELLIAVGTRDAARVVKSYQMLGVILPGADLTLLEKASERLFQRFWGLRTTEIVHMGQQEVFEFLDEFGEIIYQLPFQVPEDLILLVRCLSILSGLCTGLNPDFNVWTSVAPYARKLVESDESGRWELVLNELGGLVRVLAALPRKAETVLDRLAQGKLEVHAPELRQQLARLERAQHRLMAAILMAGLLLGGVQLYTTGHLALAAFFGAGALLVLFMGLLFLLR